MAEADDSSTDKNQQLPAFSAVKKHEQLAIILRSEGQKYPQIVNQINTDFDLTYKEASVREWFIAGGRLEQAYNEYLEFMADESVREAKIQIKKLSVKAVERLSKLLEDDSVADNIVERAARTVLAKYIPDRQILVDENKADELPTAIGDAGDAVLTKDENNNAAAEPANPPVDPPANS